MGKMLTNIWTIITILLFCLDFLSGNKIDSSAAAVGIIYIAILGLYVTSKEFERWQTKGYPSQYFGEIYVIFWTIIMLIFAVGAATSNGLFTMPGEFVITYISVLGILAVTHRSKQMHQKKHFPSVFKKR